MAITKRHAKETKQIVGGNYSPAMVSCYSGLQLQFTITETTSDFKMGVINHQITCVVFLCNICQKQTILRRKIIYDELRTFEIYILTLILGDKHRINFTSERIRRFSRVVPP